MENKNKTFIYIRLIISSIFLLSLIVIWILKFNRNISQKFIEYYGSFVIALYSIVYGIENVLKKKINFGIFLIAFALVIIILNIYMIKNLEVLLFK